MGRTPCCSKEGLNRGAWTGTEDKILTEYISIHGEGNWRSLPKRAGLNRCGKSCRLRWLNYLRPDIKRGNITDDEEELIIRLHKLLGNRWSLIAGRLPGRTDNEIKNFWNTNIGKKIQGHPGSSSKRRPSGQAQSKPNPAIEGPKPGTGTCVVRTKASRCTRVVIPSGSQLLGQFVTKPVVEPSLTHDPHDFSKSFSEENNLSNLIMDLEMDGNFLSDFLNMDFSQQTCLENEGDGCSRTCDQGHSDQTRFVSEDTLHGSDLKSVAPLESELEWLSDYA